MSEKKSIVKICSSRCYIDSKLMEATIVLNGEKIDAILPGKLPEAEDFGDAVIMPGCIDAHVHINEPGRTEWEGFETATAAALAGGTTSVVDMPLNSSPVTVSVADFDMKLKTAEGKLNCHVGFYGGIIPENQAEILPLAKAGVLGYKCFLVHSGIDEFPNVSRHDLDLAMPLIAQTGLPLLVHCEVDDSPAHSDLNSNPQHYLSYLASRPKAWENKAIAMMIELAEKHNCRVHIVHVSSAEALDLIASAKQKGLKITAETCPQYLLFEAESIPDGQTIYKCAPPIRERANNLLLKKALASGILNFIGTDHSPAPPEIKELESGNLAKAWGGIAGIQFLLSASWTALKSELTLEKFIPLITQNPALFLGLPNKGKIAPGFDADLVVWQPERTFEVKQEHVLFRHKISPYIGQRLFGSVEATFINGKLVYSPHQINFNHQGTWLKPK